MFITWVTGHVTETLPDIPYTATSVYNVNPLNVSKPSTVFPLQGFTYTQDLRLLCASFRLDRTTEFVCRLLSHRSDLTFSRIPALDPDCNLCPAAADALSYVWISSYQPSVGPAGANTVPSGRGGALIKADPATSNAVYTSYPTGDYSSPVIHRVSGHRRPLTNPSYTSGRLRHHVIAGPARRVLQKPQACHSNCLTAHMYLCPGQRAALFAWRDCFVKPCTLNSSLVVCEDQAWLCSNRR